ncbi:MAG: hypothetical protein GYB21_16765, partial [Oceanospirillales bacterium]|nr:hypothetical protein [Oceanospirillales bacterium]
MIGEVAIDYQAPEQPAIKARGNIDLTRQQLLSRVRVDITPQSGTALDPVYLDVNFGARQQLALALSRDNLMLTQITGDIRTQGPEWSAHLRSELELHSLFAWMQGLVPLLPVPIKEGRLGSTLDIRWPSRLPLDNARLLEALSAEATATLHAQGGPTRIDETRVDSIDLQLSAKAIVAAANVQLSIQPQSRIQTLNARTDDWATESLKLQLEQAVNVETALSSDTPLSVSPIRLTLSPEKITLSEGDSISLSPVAADIRLSTAPLSADFQMSSKAASLVLSGKELPSAAVLLRGNWQPDRATGSLQLNTRAPEASLSANWQLSDKQVRADWRMAPVSLSSLQPTLKRWITQWPDDLNILKGELKLSGQLSGPSPGAATTSTDIALRSAHLAYGTQLEAEGLDADRAL